MENKVNDFITAVNTNEEIREKVTNAAKAYKGEQTDEQIWKDVFAPIAAEEGYDVSLEEFKAFMDQTRNAGEISVDELEQIAGGINACVIIGVGDRPEATYEYSRGSVNRPLGAGACAYVGIGFMIFGNDD